MTGALSDLLTVARVLKSNGTEGEILLGFRAFDPEELNCMEPVYIVFDGLPVPFFVESFSRRGNNRALMRLTGIRNLEDAEEVVGKDLLVPKTSIQEYEDEAEGLTLEELAGWSLRDAAGREVGTITDYEDIPGNPCLYVDTENGQVMVPLHEELILSVDENTRTLTMEIPAGLL
ncbi:MAG: ribosome maturation factor RimM [Candidatus Cryptobacteroides sp.]|jgi:16S rRNA processing protein RimM